jgi:hypothetical protein
MYEYDRGQYLLLMSECPCDVFDYFDVDYMHGLNVFDCKDHLNNTEQAYIAGWCNVSPVDGKHFVFINLSRCTNDIHTTALVMHEMMHMSFELHEDEEELITWAEQEAIEIVSLIKLL